MYCRNPKWKGNEAHMTKINPNILPKEKHIQTEKVQNISQYIKRVNEYIKVRGIKDGTVVYRGEPDVYPEPCRPNIFRRGVMNGNRFFEKSLFDAMRQNRLTGEVRYLDNAIDAQHGEFPSRLLDVSYNCLTALYFAVTPYYHQREDSMDTKDGMVFLFFVDEIFSPSAKNTNDNYDAIINRDQEWHQNHILFEKNHKFIDHTKLNSRIIAQQGAFILFQGDEPESLPKYMSYGILIPGEAKAGMRKELRQLFGIHTGSIYPEIINLVDELSSKSRKLNTEEFSCRNELEYALRQLDKELDYYFEYIVENSREAGEEDMTRILMHVEHVIDSYRKGFLEFQENYERRFKEGEELGGLKKQELNRIIDKYNGVIRAFADNLKQYDAGEFAGQELQIYIEKVAAG